MQWGEKWEPCKLSASMLTVHGKESLRIMMYVFFTVHLHVYCCILKTCQIHVILFLFLVEGAMTVKLCFIYISWLILTTTNFHCYIFIPSRSKIGKWWQIVFSSPELKAQVSFSDHLSSVVCLSVCPSVCPSVCKLFTFSSSSPEPLGQFQPNLAQSILG